MVKRPKPRLLVACTTIRSAASHGYMSSPRSRNYVANDNVNWYSSDPSIPFPEPEDCPQCLNLGGTMARCGYGNGRNYDEPKTNDGKRMPFVSQATYLDGDTVDIVTEITAYHKGHFEFKACPLDSPDEIASQECFDQYPLTFVKDLLYGAGTDSSYPHRAYLAGEYERFIHRMKLPDGLTGSQVLLQWHWQTANSCFYPGYIEYYKNHPTLEEAASLIRTLDECPPLSPDGRGIPEQFWNCAEITILPKGSTTDQDNTDDNTNGGKKDKDKLDSDQYNHDDERPDDHEESKDKKKDKIEKNQLPQEEVAHHEESHLTDAQIFANNFENESRKKDQKVGMTKAGRKKKENRQHQTNAI